MNRPFILLAALAGLATAAPVTRLAHEIHVPHEIDPASFSLVDVETGQLRRGEMDGGGAVTWTGPVVTGISDVSDAASGFSATSPESIALTSPLAPGAVPADTIMPSAGARTREPSYTTASMPMANDRGRVSTMARDVSRCSA